MAEEEDNPFVLSMACPSYAYLWGYGGWGALGMGTDDEDDDTSFASDLERPTLLRSPALDGLQLKQIVCTKRGTFFLTGCGKVFACGSNLGLNLPSLAGWQAAVNRPDEVRLPSPALEVGLGGNFKHRFLLCQDRADAEEASAQVYCWGENYQGQLFFKSRGPIADPKAVEEFNGLNVVQVATGDFHSLALTADGAVYSCGKNGDGQLGLGDWTNHPPQPHQVIGLDEVKIVQISCGDAHSAALTDDGKVYTWGNGLSGQLGHSNESSINKPQLVRACLGMKVCYIACGSYHTAALVDAGEVLVWGSNEQSQLGLEGQSFIATPTTNPHLVGQRTIMLACGAGLTVSLSVDGRVFACGQLLETIPIPRVVLPASKGVNQIACGDRYIAAWRGPLSSSISRLRAKIRRTVDPNAALSLDMRTLIDQDQCSDLVLLLGDGTSIHAHRILLAMRSDKLKAILTDQSHKEGALEMSNGEADGGEEKKTSLCLPPQVATRAVLIFLEYLYCDELPSLPVPFFHLHAERRQQGDDAVAAKIKDDVVGQLLLLAKEYGTKPLEDLLEKLVAFPRLASMLEPAPVSGTLSSDIARALEEPLFSDLTFVVTPPEHRDYSAGDEAPASEQESEVTEIPAHKCLLAPRSDYFRAMFLNGLKEATSRRVPIVGLAPDVFRCILRYQYSGVVEEIDPDRVVDLFVAGNEFGMDALMKPCERMIESGLDMENVTELWGVATSYGSEQLKQLCISFLHKEFNGPSISVEEHLVAELPLDLIECLCTQMIASPDHSALACASCHEVFPRPEVREASPHCALCGRVLCMRWKSTTCSYELDRNQVAPELLRLFRKDGKRSKDHLPGIVRPVCLNCRGLLAAHAKGDKQERKKKKRYERRHRSKNSERGESDSKAKEQA